MRYSRRKTGETAVSGVPYSMVSGTDYAQHERGGQSGVGGFAKLAGNSGQKIFVKLSFNVVELI
jgi:hypothetical protein